MGTKTTRAPRAMYHIKTSQNTTAGAGRIPPLTLNQLREFMEQVSRGEAGIRLGKRSVTAINGMLDNPQRAAAQSISDLATEYGVNASTLSRLARTLGYRSFSDFQAVFRRYLSNAGHPYSDHLGRMLREDNDLSSKHLLSRICSEESLNISEMARRNNINYLEIAVQMLGEARRVRIQGIRHSQPVAHYLAYTLGMVHDDVALMDNAQNGAVHSLRPLTDKDLLIVVGLQPLAHSTLMIAHAAINNNVRTMAIVDSDKSPLQMHAELILVAPSRGTPFSASLASALVLAEALVTLYARQCGESALDALRKHECLLADLQVES